VAGIHAGKVDVWTTSLGECGGGLDTQYWTTTNIFLVMLLLGPECESVFVFCKAKAQAVFFVVGI